MWDTVYSRLNSEERRVLNIINYSPDALCASIKTVASTHIRKRTVKINGCALSDQFLNEAVQRLQAVNTVRNGYDMSAADPLLILLASMFGWRIEHNFAGNRIVYEPCSVIRAVVLTACNGHLS